VKTINISTFKARISEHLRRVRRGERITITDRDTPVASVVPVENEPDLVVHPPRGSLSFPKLSFRVSRDPLDFLMEDRSRG
jgi:prevent-host-death family protein